MNYMEIEKASVSNGKGFRVVLWVSGCTLKCACCQNPEAWDFNAGREFTEETKEKMFEALGKEWVRGITFSGGHPLERENIQTVYDLICEIREKMPEKDIWLYTGFELTEEQFGICEDEKPARDFGYNQVLTQVLRKCDVVVDGRYIEEQKDLSLAFRGSANQRLIDVQKTIENGEIVLFEC